jgi:hypothetical protein
MPVVKSELRSIVDEDGAVILDITSDRFFSLNPTGALIWTHLGNGETLDQIKSAIAAETGMDQAIVSADVDEFIAQLKSNHLFHFST